MTFSPRSVILGCVALLALGLLPAQAQKTYSFPKSKPAVTVTIPESWKEMVNDDDYFEVNSSGDEIALGIWMMKAKTLEEASKNIDDELGKYLKDIKASDNIDGSDLNGMKSLTIPGTAKDKKSGAAVNWAVTFFTPDDSSIYAVLYYGDPGAEKTFTADLTSISKSIKKK